MAQAQMLGFDDVKKFKRRVRQLKELGLTISLKTGYELSPRGREVLHRLDTSEKLEAPAP